LPWSPYVTIILMGSENVLMWNIQELNVANHRDAVRELVSMERPSLFCLQDTKKVVISDIDVALLLGVGFYMRISLLLTLAAISRSPGEL
jgi:hypothetical protein